MMFASTRDLSEQVDFATAVFRGLAPDGGLYLPLQQPDLSTLIAGFTEQSSFNEIATELCYGVLGDELSRSQSRAIVERSFEFSPRLAPLGGAIQLLELFHGPSCAFKDFGASFLAACMEHFLSHRDRHAVILTATSGDTGSAVAQAFHGRDNISVVILYPSGRVSPLQEQQLTTVGGNVSALEVRGSFDDCQRMVKEAFVDRELNRQLVLTSANSINLGRLLPQSFYYVWAAAQWRALSRQPPLFCVPSGNFGNLTAGVLAWRWGMRVERFLATTNANDVIPEYLASGVFTPRPSVQTLSNAMDVGNPSNFERLSALFGADVEAMRSCIEAAVISDAETLATIERYYSRSGIFLDPHTATGVLAAERYCQQHTRTDPAVICLATAHPGKFLEVVEQATGTRPTLPAQLAASLERPKQATAVESSAAALKQYLLGTFA